MGPRLRPAVAGMVLIGASGALASCGSSPAPHAAPRHATSTTTTTTTTPIPSTVLTQGVGVPNVLGMKIPLARFYLRTAGFVLVPLDAACNHGSSASQSVVVALSVPGRPPNVTDGAVPLIPGTSLPKGAQVGITWSGCYPNGTEIPSVVGHTFSSAIHLLHLAGLAWACYSVGSTHPATTTTTRPPAATTSTTAKATSSTDVVTTTTTTTTPTTTTTAPKPPPTVLRQGTPAGTNVHAGSVVGLLMEHCPQ